jgi:hypothetical protein
VKDSNLIIVVSEEIGFYIFNTTTMFDGDALAQDYLIGELNVYKMINFKEQIASTLQKPFKIVSFTLHLPT